METGGHWYRNAIIYGLDVETFYDANGDGVGDFQGLTQKLDYFVELGVTTLWLLPFCPTPNRDNGYDVSNYYDVDPRLGRLDDFIDFAHRAKERGLRIMVDIVVNHTSTEHPFFQAARRDARSRFRDYYIWTRDPPPTPPDEGTIFPGEESTVWTYDEIAGAYYYHRFYHFQPSLNASNPEVMGEVRRIIDFWLSIGADAMRMDAVSHMVQGGPLPETKPESPQSILRDLRGFLEERAPDVALMGEADEPASKLDRYFGEGDQLHMLLNFLLNNYIFLSLARGSAAPIRKALDLLPAIPSNCQWANFLRNLDEVDLERLSPEERAEVMDAFAPDEDMRIFGRGIRRRLAPMLEGDERRILLAFALMMSLPGAPVITYGDEIGLGEDLSLDGRKAVRTPMQWTAKRNAGFSDARKSQVVRQPVADGRFAYERVNVEAQRDDPASLLSRVRRLVHARRKAPEVGEGQLEIMREEAENVLVHTLQEHNRRFLGIHNLSGDAQEVDFHIPSRGTYEFGLIASSDGDEKETLETPLQLEPYGFRWYRVDPDGADD